MYCGTDENSWQIPANSYYKEIKDHCRRSRSLFSDPGFPALKRSITYSNSPKFFGLKWQRPHEICRRPQWISQGATRFDVDQGKLGDCWLLAAVASLTCNSGLLNRVVPPDQSFTKDYQGIFRFNIWHQGEWQEVVVDDRLPTNENGDLVFMHSTEKNEFWSALLEKAYAKLMGSYEALQGGTVLEAMIDFTGGVGEKISLRQSTPPNLFKIMLKAQDRNSLMGCSIHASSKRRTGQKLPNGLITQHAYSVTSVQYVQIRTHQRRPIPMVRVRNPWGNKCEWKGAWGDRSPEWESISDYEKKRLGLVFQHDGEFWMSFEDFTANFDVLEICNLGPDSLSDDEYSGRKCWHMQKNNGRWVPHASAGGCRNNTDTFWTNPQYRVTLTHPDEDDEEGLCTILISLLQKDHRKRRQEGLDLLSTGYAIYQTDYRHSGQLGAAFFRSQNPVAESRCFSSDSEVCGRHKLQCGTYVIIPSTFQPDCKGDFLLRIFTEKVCQCVGTKNVQCASACKRGAAQRY